MINSVLYNGPGAKAGLGMASKRVAPSLSAAGGEDPVPAKQNKRDVMSLAKRQFPWKKEKFLRDSEEEVYVLKSIHKDHVGDALVLDEMRPYLLADGGNVAVRDIDGGTVTFTNCDIHHNEAYYVSARLLNLP